MNENKVEVHRIVENTPTSTVRGERVPYDRNKATLPPAETQNARNLSDKKEVISTMKLVAFDARERKKWSATGARRGLDGFFTVVDARFYMGRASGSSVVYCSVWVHTRDGRGFAGRGSAGGCGYHKTSAALGDAIESAGIKLEGFINGCGEEAMRIALRAIGAACGYGRLPTTVVES